MFIATFMHYFFLVAAFWMNVMSFDVAREETDPQKYGLDLL